MKRKRVQVEAVEALKDVLQVGQENAIHQGDLAFRLGVTPNMAKSMIRQAKKHLHIISGQSGYWLAATSEEWTRYKNLWLKHANDKKFVVLPEKSEPMAGQISLPDVGLMNDMEE